MQTSTPMNDVLPQGEVPNYDQQNRFALLWEKTMEHATKFVRYDKVNVLMLSWDDTCDDIETREEVDALGEVFQGLYGYDVKKEKLQHTERPQAQMNEHLAIFVRKLEKASRNSLGIIYYAGHGWADNSGGLKGKNKLLLAGAGSDTSIEARNTLERNSIMWSQAESIIAGADADIFLIFDCCSSGMICSRGSARRRFQALAACGPDATTPIPGESSFTSALIWALKELHNDPQVRWFPSSLLREKIIEAPSFSKNQLPILADRIVVGIDNIVLAPLTIDGTPLQIPNDDVEETPETTAYIDLRFHGNKFDDEDIKNIAVGLNELLKMRDGRNPTFPVHRVSFLGINLPWVASQWMLMDKVGKRWLAIYKTKRLQKHDAHPDMPSSALSSPSMTGNSADSAEASGNGELGMTWYFNFAERTAIPRPRSLSNTAMVFLSYLGYPWPV